MCKPYHFTEWVSIILIIIWPNFSFGLTLIIDYARHNRSATVYNDTLIIKTSMYFIKTNKITTSPTLFHLLPPVLSFTIITAEVVLLIAIMLVKPSVFSGEVKLGQNIHGVIITLENH